MSNTIRTSEWVSLGHPDKTADYISEYILDRLLEIDPNVRYALECQIKGNYVSLVGEVTTRVKNWENNIGIWVREAVNKIGYTKKYQKKFGANCTIKGDDVVPSICITTQSPDIALGVDNKGWGDQGIFFGAWWSETDNGYTKEYSLAKKIGTMLYEKALSPKQPYGIDIKTQVTYDVDEDKITKVVVAIPTVEGKRDHKHIQKEISTIIKKAFPETIGAKFIINGTGEYHIHGPIGDSGTTGRKLVVDLYGSGSKIGGGSPWNKDGTKADLTLNILAREVAKEAYFMWKDIMVSIGHIETELSCCIGKQDVDVIITAYDKRGDAIYRMAETRKIPTDILIDRYGLRKPKYAELCKRGLFWETLEG